ncbi:MAG: hypothetical protein ACXU93_01070 [Thermodesulfobacteriota bacterium]
MRRVFILVFVSNVVLSLFSLVLLPSRVAIHFGVGGMANGWAPSCVNALFFIGTNTFLFLCLYFTPRLLFMFPGKWINLPNKKYWLRIENKARTLEIFSSFMWNSGTGLFLFLFAVELLTIQANLSQPVKLDEKLFLSALILFILFTVYWCIKLLRGFRLPSEVENAKGPIE